MPATVEQPASPVEPKLNVAGFRHVLRRRNFLLLWLAQLISLTILNAANFGLIVIVTDVTHSVLMAGLAILAFTFPAVPFSVIAGVVVDHMHKRTVLWVSNMLRAGTMLLVVVSLLYNPTALGPLYVLIFVTSLIGQFFTPAESASIPLLVGERELVPALSLFNITLTLAQAIGYLVLGSALSLIFPSFTLHLGAFTLAVHSIDVLFVFVAICYVVCAGLILLIPSRALQERHLMNRATPARIEAGKALEMLWQDIVEGWRFVRSDRILYFAVIQLSVVGNLTILIAELAGPFVQQYLHLPAEAMSIVLAPAAFGLIGASLVMPNITRRVDKIRLAMIGFIVLAAGFALLPGSQALAWYLYHQQGAQSAFLWTTIIVVVFVLGIATASVNIPTQALMQEHAPEAVRGRIFSLQFMMYNLGTIPVLLIAGLFAQFINFSLLILLISASLLLFLWWGRWYLRRRAYEQADSVPQERA